MWISATDFVEIKTEFYDEDNELVNTFNSYNIKTFGSHKLTSRMEVVSTDKPNQKTVMLIEKYDFDIAIDDNFFSQQNMQKVR